MVTEPSFSNESRTTFLVTEMVHEMSQKGNGAQNSATDDGSSENQGDADRSGNSEADGGDVQNGRPLSPGTRALLCDEDAMFVAAGSPKLLADQSFWCNHRYPHPFYGLRLILFGPGVVNGKALPTVRTPGLEPCPSTWGRSPLSTSSNHLLVADQSKNITQKYSNRHECTDVYAEQEKLILTRFRDFLNQLISYGSIKETMQSPLAISKKKNNREEPAENGAVKSGIPASRQKEPYRSLSVMEL